MLRILIYIQYVVYITSFTAQQKGTCCTFCKTQRNESLHKTAKKGKVAKDLEPKKSNWSISFSHLFYCFPNEFVFFFNSCSPFHGVTFPTNFKGVLCHKTFQWVRCYDRIGKHLNEVQKLWNSWRLKSQGLLLHKLPLLKGVNSVCKFVGFSWKLAWCSHTKVCKAWAKLIYFYHNVQEVATTQIFSIVQLENRFSQEPIGISEKASHALLAYYLLSDTVQFVLRSMVMQRLVIQ